MTNATPASASRAGSSRRRRGRTPLAALPDPLEQDRLAAKADRRARELLAESPELNASGRPRSHVTLPEYRRGRAPGNKGRRFPVEVLAPQEVQAILDQLPKRGPSGARNRALIVLLWRGGVRIAEALALLPKDVDLLLSMVTVLEGKGAKRRVVAIDRMACRHLAAWMRERAKLEPLDDGAPVFCTVSRDAGGPGRPMHSSTVRETLKLYARKAGVKKRVHPHGLRHTHAFELMLEDVPVSLIQAQLGHADLAMTEHYLRHLSPTQLLARISQRACPDDPVPEQTSTAAALSAGAPVATSPGPPPRAGMDPPEPPPAKVKGQRAPQGQGTQRVLDALVANGGAATQGQLRRALGLSAPTVLRHLHRLQESGAILRVGFEQNRSIIWKVAPPPVVMRPVVALRCPPNGEGPRRVLDAVDALGGRGSQAELARLLELDAETVRGHCVTLEAEGLLARGGLDRTTSRRGSQVWRFPPTRSRYRVGLGGGYSMQLTVPAR